MMRSLLPLLLAATAASAQTTGGGAAAPSAATPALTITAPTPIQPATAQSQTGQPPQNSSMRRGQSGVGGGAAMANPLGMAGMSMQSGTSALTLSNNAGGQSGMGQMPAGGGMRSADRQGMSTQQRNGAARISDTGVTQRTPARASGQR